MANKKKQSPHTQIMIYQLESDTRKQNKSKIKPHQNKTTTRNRWSSDSSVRTCIYTIETWYISNESII
jgi:hypothetical protein